MFWALSPWCQMGDVVVVYSKQNLALQSNRNDGVLKGRGNNSFLPSCPHCCTAG